MASVRIPPLPLQDWDEAAKDALKRSGMGAVPPETLPAAVPTLLNHPQLAGPFLAFNISLLSRGALSARWRELMILRVAWRVGCPYVWLEHVLHSELNGITMAEIEAMAAGAPIGGSLEDLLLVATDQLLDAHGIDDQTWTLLAEHLDRHQLMEVPFVVGTYSCIAMAFNSYEMDLDVKLKDLVASGVPVPRREKLR